MAVAVLLLLQQQHVGTATAAQEPIGAAAACGAGQVYRVTCFIDGSGHVADVQYANSISSTPVSLCHTQDWQLQASQPQTLELSAADTIVRFRACSDAAGGLRGLVFLTALGEELSCGSPAGGSCRSFSSSSTYPLRGMQATCQTLRPAHSSRGASGSAGLTRVSSITAACWAPVRRQARAQACPPGFGVRGGGLPCQPCPLNYFSPGGTSPCKPCPAGTTTLAAGQSKCGCFPGQGVYGPVLQDPEVCEDCPAGTYAGGGTLAPCQPCSTNAFDYLTSAPGSQSIADCTCAAGYGTSAVSPDTCTACSNGYYSEGPLPRAEMAAQTSASSSQAFAWLAPGLPPPPAPAPAPAPAAAWPDVWPPPWSPERHPASTLQSQARGAGLPSADLVQQTLSTAGSHLQGVQHASTVAGVENTQQRSLQQVDSEFSMPTYSPCTFCGRGCSTGGPGATSPQSCTCVVIAELSPVPTPSPSPLPPPPSPSPVVSPSPSPAPPSPSPQPSPSSPSPEPDVPECISCDVNVIQQTMISLCQNNSGATGFPILSPSGPCSIAPEAGEWNPEGCFATPDIFSGPSGWVSCPLVQQLPGNATITFYGAAPADESCTMPSSYTVVVPVVSSVPSELVDADVDLDDAAAGSVNKHV